MSEHRDELDLLLVQRALEGLDAEETRRLNELLAAHPEVDPEWADIVVGELDADTAGDDAHPVSDQLRDALLDSGRGAAQSGASGSSRRRRRPGSEWSTWAGWGVAAVLAALLAVEVSSDAGMISEVEEPGAAPMASSAPDDAPTFSEVAAASDAVVAAWAPGGHTSGDDVAGEVVWSGSRQAGAMRFAGLVPNDAGLQYQLWIFDAERDERFPVDGGVFDVPADSRVVEVPIDARLAVADPTLFAVTLEPAGGVVVSDRSRLATVAAVSD